MPFKNILIISQDLILTNYLILILTKFGSHDYSITQNLEDAEYLLKFSKFDAIFFHNQKMNWILDPINYMLLKGAKLIVLGKFEKTLIDHWKFEDKNLIHNLNIPFVSYEIKKILSKTRCA